MTLIDFFFQQWTSGPSIIVTPFTYSHMYFIREEKTEQNAILLTLKSVVFRVQASFKEFSKRKGKMRVRETMSTENSIQCIWNPNVIVPITLENRFVWVLSTGSFLFFSRVRLSQTRTTTTKYFNQIFHRFHNTLAAQFLLFNWQIFLTHI